MSEDSGNCIPKALWIATRNEQAFDALIELSKDIVDRFGGHRLPNEAAVQWDNTGSPYTYTLSSPAPANLSTHNLTGHGYSDEKARVDGPE